MAVSPLKFLTTIIQLLITALVLGEAYQFIGLQLENPWLGAALVNTFLCGAVYLLLRRTPYLDAKPLKSTRSVWAPFLPSLTVFLGSGMLVFLSQWFMPGGESGYGFGDVEIKQWAWVLWIPLVEEAVYRVGIGGVLRAKLGHVWGSYLSAILFSLMHTVPSFSRVMDGQVGIVLGAFLLGLITEALWVRYRKFWAIVTFHATCNFTSILFMVGDSRWLDWLGAFYL